MKLLDFQRFRAVHQHEKVENQIWKKNKKEKIKNGVGTGHFCSTFALYENDFPIFSMFIPIREKIGRFNSGTWPCTELKKWQAAWGKTRIEKENPKQNLPLSTRHSNASVSTQGLCLVLQNSSMCRKFLYTGGGGEFVFLVVFLIVWREVAHYLVSFFILFGWLIDWLFVFLVVFPGRSRDRIRRGDHHHRRAQPAHQGEAGHRRRQLLLSRPDQRPGDWRRPVRQPGPFRQSLLRRQHFLPEVDRRRGHAHCAHRHAGHPVRRGSHLRLPLGIRGGHHVAGVPMRRGQLPGHDWREDVRAGQGEAAAVGRRHPEVQTATQHVPGCEAGPQIVAGQEQQRLICRRPWESRCGGRWRSAATETGETRGECGGSAAAGGSQWGCVVECVGCSDDADFRCHFVSEHGGRSGNGVVARGCGERGDGSITPGDRSQRPDGWRRR